MNRNFDRNFDGITMKCTGGYEWRVTIEGRGSYIIPEWCLSYVANAYKDGREAFIEACMEVNAVYTHDAEAAEDRAEAREWDEDYDEDSYEYVPEVREFKHLTGRSMRNCDCEGEYFRRMILEKARDKHCFKTLTGGNIKKAH